MVGQRKRTAEYDALVVGAGPAGLSAARTAARLGFKTLVVERAPRAAAMGRESAVAVIPTGDLLAGQFTPPGLHFPQVDLIIPYPLILDRETNVRCISPFGYEFQPISDHEPPTVLVNRPGLLRSLVDQARTAGVQFSFGTEVTGLARSGNRVVGVQTPDGELRGRIVLVAEGSARQLCGQAGFFGEALPPERHLLMVRRDVEAPGAGPALVGQILLLGRHHAGGQPGWTSVLVTAPGRAELTFCTFVDAIDGETLNAAHRGLSRAASGPRVAALLAPRAAAPGPELLIAVRQAPSNVVDHGVMGLGDAVTPMGRLGILPAMYMGRQAALTAAEALDNGSPAAPALASYNRFFKTTFLPGLEMQVRAQTAMFSMSDDEVERVCQTLAWLRLPVPFCGSMLAADWQSVRWLEWQFPTALRDWQLLEHLLAGAPAGPAPSRLSLELPFTVARG